MSKSTAPSVLLATTDRFIFPAQLALALADAGFLVEAVCPRGHFLASTSAVGRLHPYSGIRGISSFKSAILKARPTIIIPCDDPARKHLHWLYASGLREGARELCNLIERSLGNPLSFPVVESRSRLLASVRNKVNTAVETTVVSSPGRLEEWLTVNGFPAVLKTDGSSGGSGVRVVSNFEEAEAARQKLAAPMGLARAIKRAVINQNQTFLMPAWEGAPAVINAQRFIKGTEATSTAMCWQGAVPAMLTFQVLRVTYPGGPASVVRLKEDAVIEETVRKTAAKLGLSGICGFDFIIEEGNGRPHLIEMNARATQTAHLRMGIGHDIAGAFFTAVTGKNACDPRNQVKDDTIALFPQEWARDLSSEFLRSSHHDVPWSEPALLEKIAISVGKRVNELPPVSLQPHGA